MGLRIILPIIGRPVGVDSPCQRKCCSAIILQRHGSAHSPVTALDQQLVQLLYSFRNILIHFFKYVRTVSRAQDCPRALNNLICTFNDPDSVQFAIRRFCLFHCLLIRIQERQIIWHILLDMRIHINQNTIFDPLLVTSRIGFYAAGKHDVKIFTGSQKLLETFRHFGLRIGRPVHMDICRFFHSLNSGNIIKVIHNITVVHQQNADFLLVFADWKREPINISGLYGRLRRFSRRRRGPRTILGTRIGTRCQAAYQHGNCKQTGKNSFFHFDFLPWIDFYFSSSLLPL